jgi:predicted secreted protein
MDDQGCYRELLIENSRIRILLENELNLNKIRKYVKDVLYEVSEYKKYGFQILGIIGVNRSPSCGINTTSKGNKEISGYGVFMNELKAVLDKEGIEIPMVGTKTSEVGESVKSVQAMIES